MVRPDQVRHPDEVEEEIALFQGEPLDSAARVTVSWAYKAAHKFPDWARSHSRGIEVVTLASSGVVLACVALVQKMKRGHNLEQALNLLNRNDLHNSVLVASRRQRWGRLLRKLIKREREMKAL